jgi:hypothetical protein
MIRSMAGKDPGSADAHCSAANVELGRRRRQAKKPKEPHSSLFTCFPTNVKNVSIMRLINTYNIQGNHIEHAPATLSRVRKDPSSPVSFDESEGTCKSEGTSNSGRSWAAQAHARYISGICIQANVNEVCHAHSFVPGPEVINNNSGTETSLYALNGWCIRSTKCRLRHSVYNYTFILYICICICMYIHALTGWCI